MTKHAAQEYSKPGWFTGALLKTWVSKGIVVLIHLVTASLQPSYDPLRHHSLIVL